MTRLWTESDDAIIRAKYRRGTAEAIARKLGRPVAHVRKRARRIGVSAGHRWTDAERQELMALWGEQSLGRIAKALNHPRSAVYWQAQQLGLLKVPDGFETLTNAAERTGYDTGQIRAILTWHGTPPIARTSRSKNPGHRFHHVDPFDVDEAVSAWLKTETVHEAAVRLGVIGESLRTWLGWARAAGFKVPPEPARKKLRWRVPSDLADQVVTWRRGLESVSEAARRLGVPRWRLTVALVAAGTPRVSVKPWLVAPGDADAAMAGRRAA